jgi:putative flippase GtrA
VSGVGALRGVVSRLTSREALTFLGVGGAGYVVDVVAFNLLLTAPPLAGRDPTLARAVAVCLAMVVTYLGNRLLTWHHPDSERVGREVTLFVVLNIVAMGFSAGTLFLSHDLLGLTSRLADNLSANVVGMALGTVFRYWSYKTYVFGRAHGRDPSWPRAVHGDAAPRVRTLMAATRARHRQLSVRAEKVGLDPM